MKCPVLEILHSCTPENDKEAVLESFRREDGPILVLIATIAFGMGVNCKGVHRTILFGPSKSVKVFVEETGRPGRDGKPCKKILNMLGQVFGDIHACIP